MKSLSNVKTAIWISLFFCSLLSFNANSQTSGKEFYRTPYNTRNSGAYGKGDHFF
jgi:hypothetical protein